MSDQSQQAKLTCPRCRGSVSLDPTLSGPPKCTGCGRLLTPADLDRQSRWYYSENRRKVGPISWTELAKRATDGRLRRSDMVWREGAPKWIDAGSLPKLFLDPNEPVLFELSPVPSPPTRPVLPPPLPHARNWEAVSRQLLLYSLGLALGVAVLAAILWLWEIRNGAPPPQQLQRGSGK